MVTLFACQAERNIVRLEDENDPIVLDREIMRDRPLLLPSEASIQVIVAGQRAMQILVEPGRLAEAEIVIVPKAAQEGVRRLDVADARPGAAPSPDGPAGSYVPARRVP
jgi:hypothetical protein